MREEATRLGEPVDVRHVRGCNEATRPAEVCDSRTDSCLPSVDPLGRGGSAKAQDKFAYAGKPKPRNKKTFFLNVQIKFLNI